MHYLDVALSASALRTRACNSESKSLWRVFRTLPFVATGVMICMQAQAEGTAGAKPGWFAPAYNQALRSPLPAQILYATGRVPATVQHYETFSDPTGRLGSYNTSGPIDTGSNAFFQSLGTNGRACISCHLPSNGMGLSLANVRARFFATNAKDPLFAPVDGANCPSAVPAAETKPSHVGGYLGRGVLGKLSAVLAVLDPNNPRSLLLNRGLIRIGLPWPPRGADGNAITPEFKLEVLADPAKCNTDPAYGINSANPIVSVYRRPLMSANLKFVTTVTEQFGPPIDFLTGVLQPIDPFTGKPQSGNIMWDGREPTLHSQAIDATMGHAQALTPPTAAQVQQMVDFENQVFSAQVVDTLAGDLTAAGALGGPLNVEPQIEGILSPSPVFDEYTSWATLTATDARSAARRSVGRGQEIFNNRSFTINDVAGFNDVAFVGNNVAGTCATCHNQKGGGTDALAASARDLGIAGNHAAAIPANDLPLFRLTCLNGSSTSFSGSTVLTRDPGLALITGKCSDIGRFKVSQLRALGARAPYFHDGSARTLGDLVDFYNRRFSIELTNDEKRDLINFLRTL